MQILSSSRLDIEKAAQALLEGLLVAFPTETVYGLGADARNPHALARVFEAKRRPAFDPLIIHLARREELEQVANVGALPESRRALVAVLAENLWPGPLTLVLPKQDWVPDLATSGLPTVAVRVPAHPVAQALLQTAGIPVAAPSANPFGYLSPTCSEHVVSQLGDRVDYVIDGGMCPVGLESTVLDMTGPCPTILRPGGVAQDQIEALIGPVNAIDRTAERPTAPGQLPSHYAPRALLYLYERGSIPGLEQLYPLIEEALGGTGRSTPLELSGQRGGSKLFPPHGGEADFPLRWGLLFFDPPSRDAWLKQFDPSVAEGSVPMGVDPVPEVQILSEHSQVREAATHLFKVLHHFDDTGVALIFAERVPQEGLGVAVNDRLFKARAAAKGTFKYHP